MSDYVPTKHERESAEAREALWNNLGRRPDELFAIASALTAAEERGRRAGIEERDKLRELLRNVRPLIREEFLRAGAMTERGWEKFLARVDAALAPRDSAPACDAVVSSDPFREWRCGKPKGHEGPHSGDRK